VNDRITAGAGLLVGALTASTFVSRWFVGSPAVPEARGVLDEGTLRDLLTDGDLEENEFAFCPAEERTTFHAVRADGSRRCWTCQTETAAGGVS
jgi:hypothetical protein